ncbi:hypothetical protein TB2_016567 [Malus domestica]
MVPRLTKSDGCRCFNFDISSTSNLQSNPNCNVCSGADMSNKISIAFEICTLIHTAAPYHGFEIDEERWMQMLQL